MAYRRRVVRCFGGFEVPERFEVPEPPGVIRAAPPVRAWRVFGGQVGEGATVEGEAV